MLSAEEEHRFWTSVENVQQTVLDHLNANRNISFAINFASNLHRGVDKIVQTAKDQGVKFDCTAGCSYCCNVRVETTAPEIFLIVRELKKLPPEAYNELIDRLQKHVTAAKGVSVWDHHLRCPFLNANLCSIYSVRPAVCRKAHSFNVEKCRTPGADIPGDLEVAIKAEALIKGTGKGYTQANLSGKSHELGEAVLLALMDETAEMRWYGGELVFSE